MGVYVLGCLVRDSIHRRNLHECAFLLDGIAHGNGGRRKRQTRRPFLQTSQRELVTAGDAGAKKNRGTRPAKGTFLGEVTSNRREARR